MIRTLSAAALLPLAACAHQEIALTAQLPAPPIPAAAPSPPPAAPVGLTASLVLPAQTTDGKFLTINSGLTPAEAVWHMRGALNVAALGCRGAGEAALIAGYNALLRDQKGALAAADQAMQARYRTAYGKDWQTTHDRQLTRLYNFFAQPFAQAEFCAAVPAALQAARTAPKGGMETIAASALATLETPFTDFYARAASYRRSLVLWQVAQAGQAGTAAAVYSPEPRALDRVASTGMR